MKIIEYLTIKLIGMLFYIFPNGELKLKLAADLQDDREAYSEGKTDFILGILAKVEKETENDS